MITLSSHLPDPKDSRPIYSYNKDRKNEPVGNRVIMHTLTFGPDAPYAKAIFENERDLQVKGTDCWLIAHDGEALTAEFKNTFRTTNKHAFEDYHRTVHTGKEWDGWLHTIESDLLFMFAAGYDLLHKIDYKKLRSEFGQLRDLYKYASPSYNRSSNGREDYESFNVCIPFRDLRRFGYILAEYEVVYPDDQSRAQIQEIVIKANAHVKR